MRGTKYLAIAGVCVVAAAGVVALSGSDPKVQSDSASDSAVVLSAKLISSWDFAGSNNDDTLLNKDGTAHRHCYFGTVANTPEGSADLLKKPTTHQITDNHSAGWAPAVRLPDGRILCPLKMTGYYAAANLNPDNIAGGFIQPPPFNLGVITGNQNAYLYNQQTATFRWRCPGSSPPTTAPSTTCATGDQRTISMESFGTKPCWDGKTLRAPDGSSHLAAPVDLAVGNGCPAAFPVAIPQLQFSFVYQFASAADLASDWDLVCNEHTPGGFAGAQKGACAHFDYLFAWTNSVTELTKCLNDHDRNPGDPTPELLCAGITTPGSDVNIARESRDVSDWATPAFP